MADDLFGETLPAGVERVEVVTLQPGDVAIIRCAETVSRERMQQFADDLRAALRMPKLSCIFTDPTYELEIVRPGVRDEATRTVAARKSRRGRVG